MCCSTASVNDCRDAGHTEAVRPELQINKNVSVAKWQSHVIETKPKRTHFSASMPHNPNKKSQKLQMSFCIFFLSLSIIKINFAGEFNKYLHSYSYYVSLKEYLSHSTLTGLAAGIMYSKYKERHLPQANSEVLTPALYIVTQQNGAILQNTFAI